MSSMSSQIKLNLGNLSSIKVNLTSDLMLEELKTWVCNQWSSDSAPRAESVWGVSVINKPFRLCCIPQLISDSCFLEMLKTELLDLEFDIKNNDLYQYRQSADLFSVDSPAINTLTSLLKTAVRTWLRDVTKIELDEKVSATCSCYDDTDYLLCHDDQCEDRCIAYILYLNTLQNVDEGGALQLFNTENAQPSDIAESILPQFNTFIFFEVSDKSFHQVQEVLTMDKTRITVNGWFYGPRRISKNTLTSALSEYSFISASELESGVYSKIINKIYNDSALSQLNTHFEHDSSVILECFLCDEFYQECCLALSSQNVCWKRKGPANHRLYDVADESSLSNSVLTLLNFLQSSNLFNLLSLLTCLDLMKINQESEISKRVVKVSKCSYEIRRWKAGYYTLVTDDNLSKESLLDFTMYLNYKETCTVGNTVYIAQDEEEPLLTALPRPNSVAVTYREANTASFVKYINHHFHDVYYTINFSCIEWQGNDDN